MFVFAQSLADVCGKPAGAICSWFFARFGSFGPFVAEFAQAAIPRLLKIIIIIVIAAVLVRVVRRSIKRFTRGLAGNGIARLGRLSDKAPLANTGPIDVTRLQMRTETVGGVLNSVAVFLIWGIAFFTILGTIGIQLGPLIAGAGIAGIALGFGAQNLVKDFLSGMFIILEDQYGIGDVVNLREGISAQGVSGTVEGVSLRVTRIRDLEGTVWHVPNGDIRTAGNKSQQWARSLLDVGVDYSSDVDHVSAVLKQVADELWQDETFGPDVIDEPEVWGLERFDPSELTIRMVLKVQPARQWAVNRELRARIKLAFEREGIQMPLPSQTVYLRTDDAAGSKVPRAPS